MLDFLQFFLSTMSNFPILCKIVKNPDGMVCPMICPCGPMEFRCNGPPSTDGCPSADTCMPKMKDANGMFCPDKCPCGPNEMSCPGPEDPNSTCPAHTRSTCIPNQMGNCPGVCPTFCQPGEIVCPGKPDSNGCMMPGSCMPVGGQCP